MMQKPKKAAVFIGNESLPFHLNFVKKPFKTDKSLQNKTILFFRDTKFRAKTICNKEKEKKME